MFRLDVSFAVCKHALVSRIKAAELKHIVRQTREAVLLLIMPWQIYTTCRDTEMGSPFIAYNYFVA